MTAGISALALVMLVGCGTTTASLSPNDVTETSQAASSKTNTENQIAKIVVFNPKIQTQVNQSVQISGQVLNASRQGVPNSQVSVVGLPNYPSGYTVQTNTQGDFHFSTRWFHPGEYMVSVGNGKISIDISIQVIASHTAVGSSSVSTNASSTPNIFSGKNVKLINGLHIPLAIPNGYTDKQTGLTYSKSKFRSIKAFTGILDNKIFVLEFYKNNLNGISVGVSYNNQPVYFGWGPTPEFNILNFTGNDVVLGSPSAGAYIAINLTNGQLITNTAQVVALKGYRSLQGPKYILGIPETHYSVQIPN